MTTQVVPKFWNDGARDDLDGRPTTSAFLAAARARLQGQPTAETSLLICNVDRFTQVNLNRGHVAGDHVIRRFSEIVRRNVSAEDLLERVGGAEFLVLCAGGLERARGLAGRIRGELEKSESPLEADACSVTCSVGIAFAPAVGYEWDFLLDAADQALNEALRAGGNTVVTWFRGMAHGKVA